MRVLCDYGFELRGLYRIQMQTLAGNAPLRATAARAGFVEEGVRRASAWVDGGFADGVLFGLLSGERPGH